MKLSTYVVTPLLAVLVGFGLSGTAQAFTTGSGRVATETRAAAGFEAVTVAGAMKVEIRQGDKEGLTITADDNILPLIEAVVESTSRGATLVIRSKRGESYRTRNEVRVVVDAMKITGLAAMGSGDLVVPALNTPRLALSIGGSGSARLAKLATEALDVRIAGSGDVQAEGSARALKLNIAGSGDASLSGVAADDVTVSIAGSGDASVTANKALSVSIAGSGDVTYHGNPPALKTSIAGSGRVNRR